MCIRDRTTAGAIIAPLLVNFNVEPALIVVAIASGSTALSLMMRNRSLESDTFAGKLLASLRNEFGGHDIVE